MSFEIIETANKKVIEVQITGKLTAEAYKVFVPLVEQRISEFGKVRFMVVMHDFHGWDAGALWEDIKFDFAHFSDIEQLAIVGESKWEQGMAIFCRPFTTAKIKYFDISDIDGAREWISEG